MRQGMLEARIRELESKLRHSELIEDQAVTSGVGVGSHVRLVEVASGDELDYQVVGPEETNPRGQDLPPLSPVGGLSWGDRPAMRWKLLLRVGLCVIES